MENRANGLPPVVTLRFQKGELIFNEGDYGISLYRVLKGEVLLFTKHGDTVIPLALLTEGEVFGEIAILDKGTEPYAMSARASKATEVEAWHRIRFLKEYEKMPAIYQYIVRQPLRRLAQTRKLIVRLSVKKAIDKTREKKKVQWSKQQRRHYRKEIDSRCVYRPVKTSPKIRLLGRIKDISAQGLGMEVGEADLLSYSHEVDDKFHMEVSLPNGQDVVFIAKIVSSVPGNKSGTRFFGMFITDISYENQKQLGFFLMP